MSRRKSKRVLIPTTATIRPIIQAVAPTITNGHNLTGQYLYPVGNDSRQRDWTPRFDRDLAGLITGTRHSEMVSHARKAYASCGQLRGLVRDKGAFVVGSSWQPEYKGEDERFKVAFEEVIRTGWIRNCDVRGAPFDFQQEVFLASKALDVDGDLFLLLTESDFGSPRVQPLEGHRIGSPMLYGDTIPATARVQPEYIGRRVCSGIVYDDYMRPVAYNILPTDSDYRFKADWNLVPAASVIHIWDPEWHSQCRGIPAIASGLLDWYDIGEIRSATKQKVKLSSKIGIMEFNETGYADPGPSLMSAGTVAGANQEIGYRPTVDGQFHYFRANTGNKLEEFESTQPPSTWEGFVNHILRSAHKGMDWPLEMYDMSKLGGAAVRGFVGQIRRSVARRQDVLWVPFLSAVLYAVSRYIRSKRLPFTADWFNIGFALPAQFSVDTGNDSSNRRQDILMGIRPVETVFQEEALGDVRSVFTRNALAMQVRNEIAAKYGLKPEEVYNPISANQLAFASKLATEGKQDAPPLIPPDDGEDLPPDEGQDSEDE